MTEEEKVEKLEEKEQAEKEPDDEAREEKKSVSIKGVKKDVYNRMIQFSRDTGRSLGELTNDAYRTFIGTIDNAKSVSQSFMEGTKSGKVTVIENIRNLSLSKEDLEDIGHKVELRNIDDLDLGDIDSDTFEKYINQITGVKNLTIPASLKKAKVLVRARFVDNILQKK